MIFNMIPLITAIIYIINNCETCAKPQLKIKPIINKYLLVLLLSAIILFIVALLLAIPKSLGLIPIIVFNILVINRKG